MAEGFEPYHVPQQSRRDKLRVLHNQPTLPNHNLHSHQAPLLFSACNFYDPSPPPISPDLLNLHRQSFNPAVKEEGINLMGFMGGGGGGLNVITASSSEHHHHRNSGDNNNPMYADPQLVAVHLNNPSNTTAILQDINNYNNYRAAAAGAAAVVDHPNNHDQSFHHLHHGKQVINGQSLSLSLSSHHGNNGNNNNPPLELNLHHQRYITTNNNEYDDSPSLLSSNNSNKVSGLGGYLVPGNDGLSRSSVPLGPFTGYASVLNGSRFLKPAQHLLGEICEVGLRGIYGSGVDKFSAEEEDSTALLDPDHPPLESHHDDSVSCSIDVSEQTRKKSGLLSMLEEVYKRYKMYYQQVQAVVASFESVAGLSNAAPFANLALKALTKHFRCLKDAITDQLQFATKCHSKMYNYEREEAQRVDNNLGKGPFGQRSFQNAGGSFVDQPVWRPQRGLPERAVTVLRAWLFEHFLHPYPTDTDKLTLAKQTGLSRNQVSNWFINARVRLWKPMVEEIHTLETRQGQRHNSQRDEPTHNRANDHLPLGSSFDSENNAATSMQRMGEFSLKRNREDLSEAITGTEGPTNLPYENLSHHPHFTSNVGGSGSVSLTLGLHQNGVGLAESYPLNAARRFGLDSSHGGDQGYVLGGFGGQNRHFGGNIIG